MATETDEIGTEVVVKSEVIYNWKERKIKARWGWGRWGSSFVVKEKNKKLHSLSETRKEEIWL